MGTSFYVLSSHSRQLFDVGGWIVLTSICPPRVRPITGAGHRLETYRVGRALNLTRRALDAPDDNCQHQPDRNGATTDSEVEHKEDDNPLTYSNHN